MRTSVLYTVLAVALVVGTACKGPDSLSTDTNHFAATLRGANVVGAADTSATGTATLTANADSSWTYAYTTTVAGIDSVMLYQVAATAAITTATANGIVLCAAAACTGGGTSATSTAKAATVTSARAYGLQMVFFATGARPNNGVLRGTVYWLSN